MAQDIVGSKMPAKNGYGQNGFDGATSDVPGEPRTCSPLAADLKAASDDGEHVLDTVAARGVKMDLGFQLRDIGAKAPPIHPHMSGASAGPKIPAKLGAPAPALPKGPTK